MPQGGGGHSSLASFPRSPHTSGHRTAPRHRRYQASSSPREPRGILRAASPTWHRRHRPSGSWGPSEGQGPGGEDQASCAGHCLSRENAHLKEALISVPGTPVPRSGAAKQRTSAQTSVARQALWYPRREAYPPTPLFWLVSGLPVAHGGSQARGQTRTTAAGHSHSHSGSQPHL